MHSSRAGLVIVVSITCSRRGLPSYDLAGYPLALRNILDAAHAPPAKVDLLAALAAESPS
jgi:hypothetical protein